MDIHAILMNLRSIIFFFRDFYEYMTITNFFILVFLFFIMVFISVVAEKKQKEPEPGLWKKNKKIAN